MSEKIVCITNDFGPRAGGIETFVIGLIERLPRGTVTVYTSQQGDTRSYDQKWFEQFGVKVIRDRTKVLLPTPRVFRAIKREISSQGIEKIFFGAAAPLGIMAGGLRKAGAREIVALTHGHEVWWAKLWPFNWAIRYIGQNVDHLTYLGDFTRSQISRALSQKSKSALVKIAPGIDASHFAPHPDASKLRHSLGLADKKVIVSVGRLVHRKGQDYLIAALPQILSAHPDTHILMVGEGPYRKRLEKLANDLGVESSITFIGRIQYMDLPTYICVGDLFAMPSRSRLAGLEVEGLGIVYLEASACGLPVIAGKSGGAPDAVIEGVTGVTVDGKSSPAIANAAISMLDDLEKARAMGAHGRDWVISNWAWDNWAKEFRKLLKVN